MDRNINFSLSVYFFFPLKWLWCFRRIWVPTVSFLPAATACLKTRWGPAAAVVAAEITSRGILMYTQRSVINEHEHTVPVCLREKKLRYAGMLKKLPKQAKAESDHLENLIKHSLTPMMFFITTQTKIFVSGPAVPAWWLTQLQWWSDCSPVKGEDHLILSWCNSN